MDNKKQFDIEFIKLKLGEHQFEFEIDKTFFEIFESSLSAQNLSVKLNFIKQINLFNLTFNIEGLLNCTCDRCLDDIQFPIKCQQPVIVKITDNIPEEDEEIVYLPTSAYKINIAQHVFDFILLSLPLKLTCDLVNKKCNPIMLQNITSQIDVSIPEKNSDEDYQNETDK